MVGFAVVLPPLEALLASEEVCDAVADAVAVTSKPVALSPFPLLLLSPSLSLSSSSSLSVSSFAGSGSFPSCTIGCVINVGRGIFISSSETLALYLVAVSNAHDGPGVSLGVTVEVVVVGCALQPEDDMQVVV